MDPNLGPRKADIAVAEGDDGVYLVIMVTAEDEYLALHDALFLPAVDALKPAVDVESRYADYVDWPIVASIGEVGSDAHETIDFRLDACTRLRLYTIGQGDRTGMVDLAFVEDAAKGQVRLADALRRYRVRRLPPEPPCGPRPDTAGRRLSPAFLDGRLP